MIIIFVLATDVSPAPTLDDHPPLALLQPQLHQKLNLNPTIKLSLPPEHTLLLHLRYLKWNHTL